MKNETMLKALLVDDEPFITKGLSVLVDWEAAGFTIAGTASNGRQALAFLKKHPVDLIIADIQMPVMGGLELLEILRRDKISDAHFVVLSGYSDFEYARQALRYDCMDYLLKPVMTDQLTELLQKVRASCRRNSEGRMRDEVYSSAYLAQNLLALLQEQYDDKTIAFVKSRLKLTGSVRYVSILRQTGGRVSAKQVRDYRRELAAKCREILGGWKDHLLNAPPDRNCCGVGLIFCPGMGGSEEDFLYGMQQKIQTAIQSPVTLFVGERVPHITGLGRSYQTAVQLQTMRRYLSNPAPVQFYQPGMNAGEGGVSAAALDTLIQAVEKNDKARMREAVGAVFGTIGTGADFELLRLNMDYLLYWMVRLACERDEGVNQKELLQHLQKNLLGQERADPDKLVSFMQEYADYLQSLQKDGGDILQQIEQEARQNYAQNLTLKSLSQKYYVNSAYLGQMFKKKYGVSFRDYLNNIRLEQAAMLLISTSDKVYTVARAVGYQDLDYFIERFIAAKGCTPSNYRKMHME